MPLSFDISPVQDVTGLRSRKYPKGGDQLGALVKFTKALLEVLPADLVEAIPADVLAEAQAIITAVDEVKAAYPKLEGMEP